MYMLQIIRSIAGHEVGVDVGAQPGQGYVAKARKKQRLRLVEGRSEGGIHGLFDEAAGRLRPVANGEKRGRAERGVDVAQREIREVSGQRPPAAMPLFRPDIALVPEAG